MQVDINTSSTVTVDPRVDDYVRGKMCEEDVFNFQVECMENPELLEQVELADSLLEGLQQIQESEIKEKNTKQSQSFSFLKYITVPQTAWGAIAATIILIPLMTIQTDTQPSVGTAVYVLGTNITRNGNGSSTENILLDSSTENLVLGFQAPSTLGSPQTYTLSIYNQSNTLLWQGKQLTPNSALVIYVNVEKSFFKGGNYRYILKRTEDNHIIDQASFKIKHG